METLEYQLHRGQVLSQAERKEKEDKIDDLKNLEEKLTSQKLTKMNMKLHLPY